jgi:hypothetical protein
MKPHTRPSVVFVMQTEGITDRLMAPAKLKDRIPGISGTRNLTDNISDLKAQVQDTTLKNDHTYNRKFPLK